ncbi:MAG: glycosyltransferase family 2 protein [Candidatus Microgenomates bacterium]|jgi:glycosyltransferase involved in cell wall biosynthesis
MLSVVILTKNEEKNIRKLLGSLSPADEIIVVDDNSTDKTTYIVDQLSHTGCVKAKVFTRSLHEDFAAQRNYGLEKAHGDWVLFIDADEEVSKPLMNEIIQLVNNSLLKTEGYYVLRQDYLWGRTLIGTEAGRTKLLRLIKKGKGKWVRRVHEYLIAPGNTTTLKNRLIHYPHQTLSEFLASINYYSTIHAQENQSEHKKSTLFKIMFYPLLKFINNYIILGGYQDDGQGFVVSLMMSLHSFLSWSKLWLMQ